LAGNLAHCREERSLWSSVGKPLEGWQTGGPSGKQNNIKMDIETGICIEMTASV
jgi:hypothetical protein